MLHFNTSKEVWCQATKEHEQAKWELNRDGDKDHSFILKIRISWEMTVWCLGSGRRTQTQLTPCCIAWRLGSRMACPQRCESCSRCWLDSSRGLQTLRSKSIQDKTPDYRKGELEADICGWNYPGSHGGFAWGWRSRESEWRARNRLNCLKDPWCGGVSAPLASGLHVQRFQLNDGGVGCVW